MKIFSEIEKLVMLPLARAMTSSSRSRSFSFHAATVLRLVTTAYFAVAVVVIDASRRSVHSSTSFMAPVAMSFSRELSLDIGI